MATKPIENLTAPEQAAFRAEIGVNAENVLALLEGEAVEVASIGLTDGTGTALAAGSLSLNASGKVVVHDDQSNAEDLPHLVNSLESLSFAKRAYFTAMNNVSLSVKLADIHLPASALTNGKQLIISGRTFAIWTAGAKPDTGAFLIICKEGQNPLTEGFGLNFAEGVTTEDRCFMLPLSFSVAATTWTLAKQASISSCLVRKNNAGTVTHAAAWDAADYIANSVLTGTAGEPVILQLYLATADASNVVTANLFASGQLSVIHE